jgi:hypothetical protein
MKLTKEAPSFRIVFASVLILAVLAPRPAAGPDIITEASIRAHMDFLASDALNGRGSGTRDEWIAATYVASQLHQWNIEPLGDAGDYVQTVETPPRSGDPESKPGHTWNTVGRLVGKDLRRSHEVILLTAHLDHLGARGTGPDTIYHGADDDASGTTAVLELAEALAKGPRLNRTVIFALFGSEEAGGFGARQFVSAPPVPLEEFVANLEFEMIGRPDSKVPPHTLWLTGYERSNLGPELARHGAKLVADPRPDQDFFLRSDNIQLAYRGVIAQTVSSFGLHEDYHRPSDDLSHIDFSHMTDAIRSMLRPVVWLANSSFTPEWEPGMKPVLRQGRHP